MVLGKVLREACRKVAGLKALGNSKIDVSLQWKGLLLGSDTNHVATFRSVMAPIAIAYCERIAVQISTDDMAKWRGCRKGLGAQEGRRQER